MESGGKHWAVTLNRRNRSIFFALFLLSLIPHLRDIHAGVPTWVLLSLHLLLYPQLAYVWASHSANPLRAEFFNMRMDGFLFGIWTAAWGFPMWISFAMLLSATHNVVIFEGIRALWKSLAAISAGIALGIVLFGFHLRLETHVWTSLVLMFGLAAYVLASAHFAYDRGRTLRENRRQLGTQLVQITALQVQLEELAQRDPLTGAHNRRYLDQALDEALESTRKSGQPLAILMIDIDHFKRINDSHGHSAGDHVICHLVNLLRQRFSEDNQVVCRYGGEEFLVMLPGKTMAQAATLADQLRTEYAATSIPFQGNQLKTTLSVGISAVPELEPSPAHLVDLADKALYAAKQAGRNRTVLSTDLQQTASL